MLVTNVEWCFVSSHLLTFLRHVNVFLERMIVLKDRFKQQSQLVHQRKKYFVKTITNIETSKFSNILQTQTFPKNTPFSPIKTFSFSRLTSLGAGSWSSRSCSYL